MRTEAVIAIWLERARLTLAAGWLIYVVARLVWHAVA
jgi:hypothetical protein